MDVTVQKEVKVNVTPDEITRVVDAMIACGIWSTNVVLTDDLANDICPLSDEVIVEILREHG